MILPNIHSPLWLNVLGIVCALVSLFAELLPPIARRMIELVAFAAVVCFGISGSLILRALRQASGRRSGRQGRAKTSSMHAPVRLSPVPSVVPSW